jgi:hypothetical protein
LAWTSVPEAAVPRAATTPSHGEMIASRPVAIVRAPWRSRRMKKSPSDGYSRSDSSASSRFAPTARAKAR